MGRVAECPASIQDGVNALALAEAANISLTQRRVDMTEILPGA